MKHGRQVSVQKLFGTGGGASSARMRSRGSTSSHGSNSLGPRAAQRVGSSAMFGIFLLNSFVVLLVAIRNRWYIQSKHDRVVAKPMSEPNPINAQKTGCKALLLTCIIPSTANSKFSEFRNQNKTGNTIMARQSTEVTKPKKKVVISLTNTVVHKGAMMIVP